MRTLFISLIILSGLGSAPLLANGGLHDEAARHLMMEGEYRLAMEILRDNAATMETPEAYQEILAFQSQLFDLSARQHTYSAPRSISEFQKFLESFAIRALSEVSIIFIGPYPVPLGPIAISYHRIKYATLKEKSEAEKKSLRLVSEKDCSATLENYDILKESIEGMMDLLKARIKEAPSEERRPYIGMLKQAREHKDMVKLARTNYLSYSVISPYLWVAARHLFLANSDITIAKSKNKDDLNIAVEHLSKACHKEFLYQADESVRRQFLDIYKLLKDIASKEELEDYKMQTTLLDSFDPSKARGADAWFQ